MASQPRTLAGEVVCLSGFGLSKDKAALLQSHIERRGGTLTWSLDVHRNTVLVLGGDPSGPKWEAARAAGLPVVKRQWLREVLTGTGATKEEFAVAPEPLTALRAAVSHLPAALAGVYAVINGDSDGDLLRAHALRALGCRVLSQAAPQQLLAAAVIRTSPAGAWAAETASALHERHGIDPAWASAIEKSSSAAEGTP
ncbi:hypothetical protein FNF27_06686 [Cafeteria roenbergensis]|uniref:BRCT domain-containing protein n=2 Tax=Cafeteria roenbergensis TaxID=33653 RepID=A0A5A8CXY8_CAFRO|nr:hypothetical protein FNF29_07383 [Cafeteria roenbergensis]KAA0158063.1 hypothetical protein FNF31_05566 [Cafeteria roenbergensis]KAA0170253.1 hypothetical protein FNF27_06686 [Cafeteria roenbergensis]|eukprot:KAA0147438.1 hypothetical protein FNF29_07383 [Cafeteria roenbergensis]